MFVSHSVVDAELVQELREALDRQGVAVATAESAEEGNDLSSAVANRLRSSDLLVAVVSDPPSSFVEQEARAAQSLGRPVLPVVLGKASVPTHLQGVRRFELGGKQNIAALADRIAAAVKEATVPDE